MRRHMVEFRTQGLVSRHLILYKAQGSLRSSSDHYVNVKQLAGGEVLSERRSAFAAVRPGKAPPAWKGACACRRSTASSPGENFRSVRRPMSTTT
ncbi:hypothetical protein KL86PLE_60430 [uncultured Pleomorphomonas sp.]|uniref:Uncharacterized protein n=1 Tax=uncultured Pleomorphomonas sp. TaxID=442121 RepID=A0A212LKQ2_9HYPH|nr:hypothetical protein KL86PLE_60430 [uncultured Pleomorphomonas sp.]